MALLVRTWNVFHGRTSPPSRGLHLERMVRLVTADAPDVVALQEVPVWALGRLARWSGMKAFGATAMPALGGPLARRLTALDPLRWRSLLTGQANAVLLNPRFAVSGRALRLNPWPLRREEGRRLDLSARARFEWAWNRRVCQILLVHTPERSLRVLNLHATSYPDHRLATGEVLRAVAEAPDDLPCLLAGDLNVAAFAPPGFSPPLAGIDQILVRGLAFEHEPAPWPRERRRVGGLLLSDHAPVEAVVA